MVTDLVACYLVGLCSLCKCVGFFLLLFCAVLDKHSVFLHRILLLDNTRENLAKLGVILVYFYISRGYLYWDLFHVVSFFYSNDSLTFSLSCENYTPFFL